MMQQATKMRYEEFAEKYLDCGKNGTVAIKECGYKAVNAAQGAFRLLRIPYVIEHIAKLEVKRRSDYVAEREERQAFWTGMMNSKDSKVKDADKLRASELLGKSQGDFIDISANYNADVSADVPKADKPAYKAAARLLKEQLALTGASEGTILQVPSQNRVTKETKMIASVVIEPDATKTLKAHKKLTLEEQEERERKARFGPRIDPRSLKYGKIPNNANPKHSVSNFG